MNALLRHLDGMPPQERKSLADRIGTTPQGLHQLAHAYRTQGELRLTAETAARVEWGTGGAVKREECCLACGNCDLAAKARALP